ncbi:hypothetical protein GCM10011506_13670 [Marivirga lumbricoides]|uniref:Uncharacterized protein n=1 Tax=Marivirga lumbricoides TaxID=1046115 RepID=A0A2T4DPR1_9BACT|nr:hypothetical protein C9994_10510 [Marivirga lumbricoides]GGC29517.1 hypothetical protein GCM10011506_13670 [Marivirga lumbricoides]
MKEEQFTADESLQIIREMVAKTKHDIASDRVIYLMWGYGVAISSLLHYGFQFILDMPQNIAASVWLSMPVLGIINGVYFTRKSKKINVKTYIDRAMSSVWLSFIAALLVFLFSAPTVGWEIIYPALMVLYGIGASISGGILKFKPLIFGGAISMAIAFVAFHFSFEIQLLLLAAAIIASFIIPAHQLPRKKL